MNPKLEASDVTSYPRPLSHVRSLCGLQVRYFTGYGLVALIEKARVKTKAAVEGVAGIIIGIEGSLALSCSLSPPSLTRWTYRGVGRRRTHQSKGATFSRTLV